MIKQQKRLDLTPGRRWQNVQGPTVEMVGPAQDAQTLQHKIVLRHAGLLIITTLDDLERSYRPIEEVAEVRRG